mgnify:CR=1 FL=1
MEQRTPEWYAIRKGRITASSVGAILGLSPHAKPDDVMRRMIREYQGLEPEFTGNTATEYGNVHESLALADYSLEHQRVEQCGFFPFSDWLGASPDGLIGDDAILEIKCPYSLRNGGEFKSIAEQPHYYAQIQIQLWCTGRQWCDFYQWSAHGYKLESVPRNDEWIAQNIIKLSDFYQDYLALRDKPLNDFESLLVDDYFSVSEQIKKLEEFKKELLEKIVAEANGQNAVISGHKLTKVTKAGSISYAKVVKDLIPHADLKKYQGETTEYWKLS